MMEKTLFDGDAMIRVLDAQRAEQEAVDVGDTTLPPAEPDRRLRWDLPQLHAALNEFRQKQGLTRAALAEQLNCTPSRLTNLKTARLADMDLAMRITQHLGRPAAEFVHPARW